MITINQFTGLLKQLAGAHEQLKTFGEGDAWEIGASKNVLYPLMWATPQASSTAQKLLTLKFRLYFADLVFEDKSNEQEVLSDTLQIALDILAQLNDPAYSDSFILDPNAQLTPYTESFDDEVAGWKADISIKINYLSDRCAVPSSLIPSTETPLCAPVVLKNSDGTYTATFSSGAAATLPDIQFTDSDGAHVSVPAQKNITAKTLGQLVSEDTVSQVHDALTAASKLGAYIGILSDTELGALTSAQLDYITQLMGSSQIALLSESQVQELTLSQVQELLNSQLGNLTSSQLQYLLSAVMSGQLLQDNLSITQRNGLNEIYSLNTGQSTSYASKDDGDLKQGRLVDFFTLSTNNIFGNTHRFTDENGNQSYTSHYMIDHATGLGWYTVLQSAAAWTTAVSATLTLTVGTNTYSDFFLPNVNEVLSITSWNQVCLNYAPFNLNPGIATQIWSSTTNYSNTISAIRISIQTFPGASSGLKAANQPYLFCRKHF
jgi:hypothetical protein